MIVVGIDPGQKGAIALLDGPNLVVHDMPYIAGVKGGAELNLFQLGTILGANHDHDRGVAALEIAAPRPKEGVSSSFRSGRGFGALEMALAGHGWERNYVAPSTWKKHFKLSTDKNVSRALAMQRFPAFAHLFQRVKDDGRAEATLLALYALEVLIPQQNR